MPSAGGSFERKLALLVACALASIVAVSIVSYLAISRIGSEVDDLVDNQELLSASADADMMHDALRADVALALLADEDQLPAIAADAERHERQVIEDLDTASAALARLDVPADDPLAMALTSAADGLAVYGAQALSIVDLVDDDPAAARAELSAFLDRSDALEVELAGLTDRVSERARGAQLDARDTSRDDAVRTVAVAAIALVVLVFIAVAAARTVRALLRAKDDAEREATRVGLIAQQDAERQEFKNRLNDALDMVDNELDVFDALQRAMSVIGDGPMELLLADNSRAHLRTAVEHRDAGSPACPVQSPWECVAVRRGQAMVFPSTSAVNVCPKLRERAGGPCAAACVPVTFMGRPLGVVHAVGPDGELPDEGTVERLSVLATEAGTRIGTIRAFAKTQLQAATDALTGLPNRRTLEDQARALMRENTPFSLAVADLDHFKLINDTHGHDAGDRALRLFARVLRSAVRSVDLVARYGGEEFVVVLPGCREDEAVRILGRVREELALALLDGRSPAFTVSFGVSHAEPGSTFDEVIESADQALYAAKTAGRDRIQMAGVPPSGSPEQAPREIV